MEKDNFQIFVLRQLLFLEIVSSWRLKTNCLYVCALSCGGGQSNQRTFRFGGGDCLRRGVWTF